MLKFVVLCRGFSPFFLLSIVPYTLSPPAWFGKKDYLLDAAVVVGTTNDSGNITFAGEEVATAELREAWSATLPNLFGHAVGANSVVE